MYDRADPAGGNDADAACRKRPLHADGPEARPQSKRAWRDCPTSLARDSRPQRCRLSRCRESTGRNAPDELGKTFGLRTSETLCDGVKQAVVSKKKGWFSKLKDDVSDFGSAVKTSVSNVVSAAKKSYQNHGTVYDIVEYGKGAVKIGKSIVKIAGAVAACSTVAGIPVALCIITSAGNDIASASADIVHVARDEYDEVGKTNYLKDLLKKNGGELGEMLGNKKAGEKFGELAYTGLDMVSLLKGTEKMLKSFGKLNTDLTGKTGYSFLWGQTSFEDVIGNEFKWYKPDEWLRSKFMNADSTANFVIEAAKNVKSFYKQSKKYVDEMLEFAFR